jgi:hypothetical protein
MDYPATTAILCSIINRKAGLLIADSNFGPEYCLRLQGRYPGTPVPQLRQWSDITYLPRMDARDLHPVSSLKASNLRYVLRLNIINDHTLAVIQHILESLKWFNANSLWPGVEFGMNTEEGKALLGTLNGSGVGFPLAQHKEVLGMHKSVKQVRLL